MATEILRKQQTTPAIMIQEAVAKGADLEQLKGLLQLQKEYEANEARKAYHKAMAAFKKSPPTISKNKKVKYSTDKGTVSYDHATLFNVVENITSALSVHGFSASWRTEQNGKIKVTCMITHALGHSEEVSLSADADASGSKNSIQALGSTVTYLERYTLLAATGLATKDQDNDGKTAEVLIDKKQLSNILDLLVSRELTEKKLLEYMKLDKLEDMKASDYMKALQAINSAKKKDN